MQRIMQISSASAFMPGQAGMSQTAGFAAETANPAPSTPLPVAASDSASHTDTPPATGDEAVSLSGAGLALQRGAIPEAQPALTYGIPQRPRSAQGAAPAQVAPQIRFPDAALLASLRAAGIPTQPVFELDVNRATGETRVVGTRPDAAQIENLINHPAA